MQLNHNKRWLLIIINNLLQHIDHHNPLPRRVLLKVFHKFFLFLQSRYAFNFFFFLTTSDNLHYTNKKKHHQCSCKSVQVSVYKNLRICLWVLKWLRSSGLNWSGFIRVFYEQRFSSASAFGIRWFSKSLISALFRISFSFKKAWCVCFAVILSFLYTFSCQAQIFKFLVMLVTV